MNKLPKVIAIVGQTASGKTSLSLRLAKKYNGEIINADSRQVYQGMNIGTAKPVKDKKRKNYYVAGIRHYLLDIVNPSQEFTLADYKKLAYKAIEDILKRGKMPIIVGGTGLYIKSIVDNYDIPAIAPDLILREKLNKKSLPELVKILKKHSPESAKIIDLENPRRVMRALEIILSGAGSVAQGKKLPVIYSVLQLGIDLPREELYRRINERVDEQVKSGLLLEVKKLSKKYSWSLPAMSGIGYKQVGYYLRHELTFSEAVEMIKRDTRRYAKRQMTWFKKEKNIKWITNEYEAEKIVDKFIKQP